MIQPTEYYNRSVAIIGLARTGLAVAEAVRELGGRAVIYDDKPAAQLEPQVAEARRVGAQVVTGSDAVDLTGIDLLIPSPGVRAESPAFEEARRRGVEVISEIELAYRLSEAPIIAVTGTNGKTTTTVLTGRILEAAGRKTFIAGNVVAGDIRMPLTTAAMAAGGDSVIAAEISSFQLEWIRDFRPRVAMLLNVSADHLDRHPSIAEYARIKARIFENQDAGDFAVINAENPVTAALAPDLAGRVLRFARLSEVDEGAFVRGDDLVARIDGRETLLCSRGDIHLRGEHNVENVLAAGCAAVAMGVDPEAFRQAVRDFRELEHRLEPVAVVRDVTYINNSMCTNVDAAVRSIEAIEKPQVVISGGRDKGSDYRELGRAFARCVKHAVLIGADRALIRKAAEEAGFLDVTEAGSMEEAVKAASKVAEPGDVVVLTPACSSFDMFGSFEERGRIFKQLVLELGTKESSQP